jgi:hypothetical protein
MGTDQGRPVPCPELAKRFGHQIGVVVGAEPGGHIH